MKHDPQRDPPRVIRDLPATQYHALHALSASGAWILEEDCPAKFLWQSPWNPQYEREETTEFGIGTAAHLAVLEPARFAEATLLIDAANYKGGKAKDERDTARAAGIVPLLPWQLDIVQAIARSIQADPIAVEAFTGGDPEVTLTWRDAGTGVPCKARVDWLPRHARWLVDLKTAASANPVKWRDPAARLGYYARAAWYIDGAEAVFGKRPEEYWFVVVEKEPPWLVSTIALDEAALEWGRMVNRRALDLFAACAARGEWPGYRDPGSDRDRAFRVGLPNWAIYQLQDKTEAGALGPVKPSARPDPKLLRAAERMLAPDLSEAERPG